MWQRPPTIRRNLRNASMMGLRPIRWPHPSRRRPARAPQMRSQALSGTWSNPKRKFAPLLVRSAGAPRVSSHEATGPPRPIGLESVKKNQQVAASWNGAGGPRSPAPTFGSNRAASKPMRASGKANQTWIFPGFSVDDGPGNKAPRDAGRRTARRRAGRPDRLELAAQPRRLARGGGSANPRRDRSRPGHQGRYRHFGVPRQLRLLS